MKRLVIIIFLFFFAFDVRSQQVAMFSQYFLNDVVYNPAISGSKDYNPLVFQTRKQWIGFDGSPFFSNISYHGSVNNRSALGGFLDYHYTSPSNQANFQLNYAYHVPLNSDDVFLSFGIGSKIMYYYLDFNETDLPPGYDPAFSANAYQSVSGNASSGVYLYGKNFHIGYSIINMISSDFNTDGSYGFSKNIEERTYYGLIGYDFDFNQDLNISPSILIRKLDNGNAEYNFSGKVSYLDRVWSAISIRSTSSLSFMTGFYLSTFDFGYSFDHYFGEIGRHQNGTHEIILSFRIQNLGK